MGEGGGDQVGDFAGVKRVGVMIERGIGQR